MSEMGGATIQIWGRGSVTVFEKGGDGDEIMPNDELAVSIIHRDSTCKAPSLPMLNFGPWTNGSIAGTGRRPRHLSMKFLLLLCP